ncbi:hypothetical protein Hypma_000892 [Hypsizygus marmoreus]|uniref:UspA domain-containing protein n=1 Tax=Hypsizygus marmoreus TaxID=39966 RepID=A0A369JF70_HYPMA|nr:hypothetical protein Hypma_000892 [Hypsizygus marmoreus]
MSVSDKKRSWTAYIPRPGSSGGRSSSSSSHSRPVAPLATPEEGKELAAPTTPSTSSPSSPIASYISLPPSGATTPVSRTSTFDLTSFPGTSTPRRRSSILTQPLQALDQEASQLILNALERTASAQAQQQQQGTPPVPSTLKPPEMTTTRGSSGSFSKSFSSMIGGLSSLSLTRTSTRDSTPPPAADDKEARGRSMNKEKRERIKSASQAPPEAESTSRSRSRAHSSSPFSFRRPRQREPSPPTQAIPLAGSDVDLTEPAASIRPRSTAFTDYHDSGDETVGDETEEEEWSDEDFLDPITERNTERNAIIAPVPGEGGLTGADAEVDVDPDPLGEGVNVVVPPEPYFPSTLMPATTARGKRGARRRKSVKHHEPLVHITSRPVFQRDRCTITITQGEPRAMLGERRKRRYVVASDLSQESRYAVEWAIGTVLRDGDDLLIVTVIENESKVDPPIPNAADRATKLRSQQERQGMAYILVRQATSLLQRTKLNVTVACQAWHAKNARHMLLDIVDYNEPTMLIVGSRGMSQLKGILLGSTSHYLIQKCSVPVMVARRRLKRPPRRSAHLSTHRTHVSLAEAGIDKVASKVDEDVKVMRDEIKRDDDRRGGGPGSRNPGFNPGPGPSDGIDDDPDDDGDDDDDGDGEDGLENNALGIKVAGDN